ncbi:hypothetical protein M9Y10_041793 [Tritrichomonas musculus]|uniref:non-specific serine/threonine protein kinase n=1 Tax=Tritrichomonas musculus TaxID=1915356 RepID=A0ABR2K5G2_9EUKA
MGDAYDLAQLQLLDKIGEGPLGNVYKTKEAKKGDILLVKTLSSKEKQVDIMKSSIYNDFLLNNKENPSIITEYTEQSLLNDIIYLNQNERSKATLDDTQKLIILYGIAATLSFLHSQEILHSDLKPSNIFLDKDCKIKISDFGISKLFRQKYDENAIFYLSPEIIESNFTSYTKEGDIYAFSIIAYQI